MPSFRLRVRSTDIDLPTGELIIGRSPDCFLRVDDDLVSRRHARLLVTEESVVFEDLGSRNGSRVNGGPAAGRVPLKIGDRFEVGSQVFQLITGESRDLMGRTMLPHRPCRACGRLIAAGSRSCSSCGASQQAFGEPLGPRDLSDFDESHTHSFTSSFALVTGLSDKLLALGRTEEAERMLGPRLRELLDRAKRGELPDGKVVAEGIRRALRLAVSTGKGTWYAWIFEVARLARTRIDPRALDELHASMMAHKPEAGESLVALLRSQKGDDAEAQLYRKRLEALLRFCRT